LQIIRNTLMRKGGSPRHRFNKPVITGVPCVNE